MSHVVEEFTGGISGPMRLRGNLRFQGMGISVNAMALRQLFPISCFGDNLFSSETASARRLFFAEKRVGGQGGCAFFSLEKNSSGCSWNGRHDHDYCLLTDVDCALAGNAVPISSSSRFGVCCVVLGSQLVCDMRSDSGVWRGHRNPPAN